MTARRVCRQCDDVITDPDDAVLVWREESMSGPGRDVWAHRDHADLIEPDTTLLRILTRITVARAIQQRD